MDKATRDLTRMCEDEEAQWKNVIEWAKRNPLKDATIYALDADERDRIISRITLYNGGNPPLNVVVTVKPDTTPVTIRV